MTAAPVGDRPRTGPLAGLKVVELAGIGPGPFACMLLADLGADVVRVDRPGTAGATALPSTARHDYLSRGKRSVAVDLKHERGAEVVLGLAAGADVLIEGYRPGVAERLGVGPDDCWARNPKLIYGRMTGWGQDGPLAQTAGHDIGYLAITGALHAIGRAGGPPQIPVNLLGDFAGGSLYLVCGVLAALWEAARSGRGQVVDAAIVDGAAHLLAMPLSWLVSGAWRDERGVNLLDSGAPFYDVYQCSDEGWIAIGPLEAKFYAELLDRLGLTGDESLPAQLDREGWPVLRERLTGIFATRTRDEWAEHFADSDACVAPVLSMREAASNPHLAARSTYVLDGDDQQPAPAPRFSRTPAGIDSPPAVAGEHTEAVLADWDVADASGLLDAGAAVPASKGGPR
jgi:alpha-methylacyl-CoA racemase